MAFFSLSEDGVLTPYNDLTSLVEFQSNLYSKKTEVAEAKIEGSRPYCSGFLPSIDYVHFLKGSSGELLADYFANGYEVADIVTPSLTEHRKEYLVIPMEKRKECFLWFIIKPKYLFNKCFEEINQQTDPLKHQYRMYDKGGDKKHAFGISEYSLDIMIAKAEELNTDESLAWALQAKLSK